METNIGSEEQWRKLDARHPGLIDAVNELADLSGKVATTSFSLDTLAHELVFALSHVCIEECWEVFLLAANEYDTGAFKLLRGLYERALTLTYISKFPEKAKRFSDYAAIQDHRLLTHARKVFSDDVLNAVFTVAQVEKNYTDIKPHFQKTKCTTCKTTETAHSWDIDLVSMATKTGEGFPEMLLAAYMSPTLEAHTTLASALSRTSSEDRRVTFNYKRNPTDIDLCLAHTFAIMDIVFKVTIGMFALPLQENLERYEQVSFRAWAKNM